MDRFKERTSDVADFREDIINSEPVVHRLPFDRSSLRFSSTDGYVLPLVPEMCFGGVA